ncbi:MAG TPA: hypothetical protein VFN10_22670 [Thermoanaerobaculia bacterium]|nr:hypothetical protein [Thermoanaerobaculia bacterium]
MKQWTTVLALALLSLACRKETSAPPAPKQGAAPPAQTSTAPADLSHTNLNVLIEHRPDVLERSTVGSQVANGAVVTTAATFKPKEPVSLTMWLKESPPELQVAVRWLDAKGKEVAAERKPANGQKVITFTLGKALSRGKYHAEGYWGGNLVADHEFEVK